MLWDAFHGMLFRGHRSVVPSLVAGSLMRGRIGARRICCLSGQSCQEVMMRTRHSAVVVIVSLVAVVALLTGFQVNADQSGKDQNANEMVEAAKNALKATMAANEAGRATIEDIYQWSRRLMAAEQRAGKANAAADHLERMDQLHQKTAALYRTGSRGGSEEKFYGSKFYLLEA